MKSFLKENFPETDFHISCISRDTLDTKLNSKIYPINAKSSGSYQTSVLARADLEKTKKFH